MLSRLLSKLKSATAAPVAVNDKTIRRGVGHEPQRDPDDPLADVPRYPPFDTGIPVKTPEQIYASQSELIARIFRTAGVSRADFAHYYEPIIRALARHHHLLPATATTHHRGAGGLFRMALEIGLQSLQTANASIFPTGAGVEQRYAMLPRWTLATFIAGVGCQGYRTVTNMVVLDRVGNQWTPLLQPLYDWAQNLGTDVYFIRWTEDRNQVTAQATSAYLVNQIVTPEVLQYLAADNNQIVPMMSLAVTGSPVGAGDNPIARIIAPVITRIVEDDLKRAAMNYGHLSIGAHLEPHLIDAMRRLIREGTWAANHKGMRLWVGTDGTFIEWDVGSQDVVNILTRDAFAGVPRDPDTLADMLCNSGVFERAAKGRYWSITLPGTAEVIGTAVKIKHPDLVLPSGFDQKQLGQVSLTIGAQAMPAVGDQGTETKASYTKNKSAVQTTIDLDTGEIQRSAQEQGKAEAPIVEAEQRSANIKGEAASEGTREAPREKATDHGAAQGKSLKETEQAQRLLNALKKENAWLMREIISAYSGAKLTGYIASLPNGVGISHEELSAHGQPGMDLVDELNLKGWLWVDKTKPTRKLHMVDTGGRQYRMVVLRTDIAMALGFKVETA